MKRLITKATTVVKSYTVTITAGELRKRFRLPEGARFTVVTLIDGQPEGVPPSDDALIATAEWEERTEGQ
jgi:hypothetical protein